MQLLYQLSHNHCPIFLLFVSNSWFGIASSNKYLCGPLVTLNVKHKLVESVIIPLDYPLSGIWPSLPRSSSLDQIQFNQYLYMLYDQLEINICSVFVCLITWTWAKALSGLSNTWDCYLLNYLVLRIFSISCAKSLLVNASSKRF